MINEIVEAISGENGLLKEVYGDLAKPGVKQVGKALETVLGLGNTVLIPIQLLNAKGKFVVESNLNKYREKLEGSNIDDIVQVAPEVGVPILEKLTYVTNDELINLYTELLAKASSKSNCGIAHPNFVNIINSLSPDEALLIGELKGKQSIPFVDKTMKKSTGQYHIVQSMITKLEDTSGLAFPKNTKAYISNLEALGLLNVRRDVWLHDEQVYTELSQRYRDYVTEDSEYQPDTKKGVIEITNLGTMFIDSCVEPQA
ncbi:DUF4393 domain-containing protein [Vibrio vulnificus]|nr:DUF4393 domain-containing protein [Vibrio vulnificus]ELV8738053.1 DUF4393 domain-containing protein [Vibrio vulnificus]